MSMLKSAASVTIAIVICHASLAGGLSFRSSPLKAGRASLTEDGSRISRSQSGELYARVVLSC
jgi:hypothetical protein